MKNLVVFAVIGVLATASAASAQITSTIAGGPHDLSSGSALRIANNNTIAGQTCVFCHTPHGGDTAKPLWNRNAPGTTYTLYSSSTTVAVTDQPTLRASVSGACLSCHDGTIAMDSLANVNGIAFTTPVTFTVQGTAKNTYSGNKMGGTGLALMGSDLRNDHPVNVNYLTAYNAFTPKQHQPIVPDPNGAKVTVGGLPLYGTQAAPTVECASCHDPHDNSKGNFLRKSNQGSAMCLSCHIK